MDDYNGKVDLDTLARIGRMKTKDRGDAMRSVESALQ